MVDGIGGDCACVVVLLQTTYAVSSTFGAGDCPVTHEIVILAGVGLPSFANLCGGEQRRMEFGEVGSLGHTPCARTVADESVGEEDDGSHVLHGYT